MKQFIAALTLSTIAFSALAADTTAPAASKPMTRSQQKMADCASANQGKTGDDYKTGVKACMRSSTNPLKEEQKLSACKKANEGKKGDDYKAAVKECMAASAAE